MQVHLIPTLKPHAIVNLRYCDKVQGVELSINKMALTVSLMFGRDLKTLASLTSTSSSLSLFYVWKRL